MPKDAEVEPPAVMLVDSGDTGVHQIYAYAGTKPLNVRACAFVRVLFRVLFLEFVYDLA